MTVVGPDYKFMRAHIGGYGENSEGNTFEHLVMGEKFGAGTLNDPRYETLPGKDDPTLHVLIGYQAFPLKRYIMRSCTYRKAKMDELKGNYKCRMCRARHVLEIASDN
jgi:hypothetical protein